MRDSRITGPIMQEKKEACDWLSNAEFTTALVTHARQMGRAGIEGYLTQDGQRLDTPEEHDVFRLLGLE